MPDSQHNRRLGRAGFALLLTLAFLFRLGFGLCLPFWSDDEKQIYLIGLKFYSTHAWPYFGPDVTNTIQIPGALQGLLVGLPLFVVPVPEAPYVLLNLLSFAALCFFAWYCTRRLPELPGWFVWTWLLIAPWTLNLSTHIFNPSYVLVGGILFFVGAIETWPAFGIGVIPPRWANFMMGFALLWVMQLHLSWVVLIPFLLASFYFQYQATGRNALPLLAWLAAGAAISGFFLIPTYIKYGFVSGMGSTGDVVQVNWHNLRSYWNLPESILGRFLSLASFELPRFIGRDTSSRMAFIRTNAWLIPFVVFLGVVGLLQPIALLVLWFRKETAQKDWRQIKYLTLFTLALLYVSFLFSFRAPNSHTLYVTFPVVMLYSLYCWNMYLTRAGWRKFAAVFLVAGVIFNLGLAVANFHRQSLYLDRGKVQAAIDARDYRILGERREGTRY
ncbi:MAG: hypothetical protein ABI923_01255 [bacterium]